MSYTLGLTTKFPMSELRIAGEVSLMSTLGPKTRPGQSRSLCSKSTVSIPKFIPGPTAVYHSDLILVIAFEMGKSKHMEWEWDNYTRSHQVGPVSGFLAHEEHWSLRIARHWALMKCEMCGGLKGEGNAE